MVTTTSPDFMHGRTGNNTSFFTAIEEIFGFSLELTVFLIMGVILLAIAITLFVIKGIAIYKMSQKLNIGNAPLSFVPFCSHLIFGKIAENYYKNKGLKPVKFSIILFILKICQFISFGFLLFFVIVSATKIYDFAYQAILDDTTMTIEMFSSIIPVVICFCICLAISIAYFVLFFVAFYRICNIFDEKKATVFTVVSVFLPFLAPIFLLVISKNKTKAEE